jgi:hypothetical protein
MTDKMIVLADLGRVKAYRVTHDLLTSKPQIELVYDCEFLESHTRLAASVSDHAGRFAAGGMSGASISENHNLRGETERRLIRLVAEKICDLVQGQRSWYLAAGEGINARLIDHLNPAVRSALAKNIPSDLVKTPKQQILDYFMTAVA